MATFLQEFSADLASEVVKYQALLIEPSRRKDYLDPLHRFKDSARQFPGARDSMEAAPRCLALGEWEAAIFHSMNVLEHGIRWLAEQLAPVTFAKSIDLASWGEILNSIRARIDAETRATPPP